MAIKEDKFINEKRDRFINEQRDKEKHPLFINEKRNKEKHPFTCKALTGLAIAGGFGAAIDELNDLSLEYPVTGICKLSYAAIKFAVVAIGTEFFGETLITIWDDFAEEKLKEEVEEDDEDEDEDEDTIE